MLRNQLPKEVIDDFDAWLDKHQMVRMDTRGSQDGSKGMYVVEFGDLKFEFHGVEMPPPSGVVGTNYTRFAFADCMWHFSDAF